MNKNIQRILFLVLVFSFVSLFMVNAFALSGASAQAAGALGRARVLESTLISLDPSVSPTNYLTKSVSELQSSWHQNTQTVASRISAKNAVLEQEIWARTGGAGVKGKLRPNPSVPGSPPVPVNPSPQVNPTQPRLFNANAVKGILFFAALGATNEAVLDYRLGGNLGGVIFHGVKGLGIRGAQATGVYVGSVVTARAIASKFPVTAGRMGFALKKIPLKPLFVATAIGSLLNNFGDTWLWNKATDVFVSAAWRVQGVYITTDEMRKDLLKDNRIDGAINVDLSHDMSFVNNHQSEKQNVALGRFSIINSGFLSKLVRGLDSYIEISANEGVLMKTQRGVLNFLSAGISDHQRKFLQKSSVMASTGLRKELVKEVKIYFFTSLGENLFLEELGLAEDGAPIHSLNCGKTSNDYHYYRCDLTNLNLDEGYYIYVLRTRYHPLNFVDALNSNEVENMIKESFNFYPLDEVLGEYGNAALPVFLLSNTYDFEKNDFTDAAKVEIDTTRELIMDEINSMNGFPSNIIKFVNKIQERSGYLNGAVSALNSNNHSQIYTIDAILHGYPRMGLIKVGNPEDLIVEGTSVLHSSEEDVLTINFNLSSVAEDNILDYFKTATGNESLKLEELRRKVHFLNSNKERIDHSSIVINSESMTIKLPPNTISESKDYYVFFDITTTNKNYVALRLTNINIKENGEND